MAIVAMRHLRLIGLQSEREEILQKLQHLGCLEVIEPVLEEDDPLLQQLHAPVVPVLGKAREQFTAAEQALQTLGHYAPKQKQGLAPQPEITERQLTDPQEIEQCKNAARRLNEMRQRIQILQAHREKLTAEYHLLRASLLARDAGAETVCYPSHTKNRAFFCLMFVREIFGVWYALALG